MDLGAPEQLSPDREPPPSKDCLPIPWLEEIRRMAVAATQDATAASARARSAAIDLSAAATWAHAHHGMPGEDDYGQEAMALARAEAAQAAAAARAAARHAAELSRLCQAAAQFMTDDPADEGLAALPFDLTTKELTPRALRCAAVIAAAHAAATPGASPASVMDLRADEPGVCALTI